MSSQQHAMPTCPHGDEQHNPDVERMLRDVQMHLPMIQMVYIHRTTGWAATTLLGKTTTLTKVGSSMTLTNSQVQLVCTPAQQCPSVPIPYIHGRLLQYGLQYSKYGAVQCRNMLYAIARVMQHRNHTIRSMTYGVHFQNTTQINTPDLWFPALNTETPHQHNYALAQPEWQPTTSRTCHHHPGPQTSTDQVRALACTMLIHFSPTPCPHEERKPVI